MTPEKPAKKQYAELRRYVNICESLYVIAEKGLNSDKPYEGFRKLNREANNALDSAVKKGEIDLTGYHEADLTKNNIINSMNDTFSPDSKKEELNEARRRINEMKKKYGLE